MFAFKIDFEKAFDSVKWGFLLDSMAQMGFGHKWCMWISGCLSSASVSVLINGSPSKEFAMERGLRQGDPLSPLLFLIVADALQMVMRKACSVGVFNGVFIKDREVKVSLLQYADDALIFGKWDRRNIKNLIGILDLFHKASGLRVNIDKSVLYGINVSSGEVGNMASCFQCKHDSLPFVYLGLPVGANMRRAVSWKPVLEKIENRLASWRAKLLSVGGRLTITKSVLDALPVYFMSLFRIPKKVGEAIDKLRRKFFWNSNADSTKCCWVAWKYISAPKKMGGLGVKNIEEFNLSLLSKWIWRFYDDKNALWIKVIKNIYGDNGSIGSSHFRGVGSTWSRILDGMMDCKVKGVDLVSMLERRVFNGCSTRFWTDSWLNDLGPLAIRYPRLFAREVQKDCFVAERWVVRSECWGPEWNWNQAPRGRGLGELEALNASLQGLKLDARKNDLWRWKLDKDGCFSVRGTYDFLCSKFYKSIYDGSFDGKRHEWNSMIPAKVNIFMWRALIDRLPFKNNLIGKGIEVNNASCLLCGFSDEWDQHVFFSCAKSEVVWRKVFSWWKTSFPVRLNWVTLIGIWKGFRGDKVSTKAFHGVCCIVLWAIWNWRNRIAFSTGDEKKRWEQEDIFPFIQNKSFLWCSNRHNSIARDWICWISDPKSCMM